MKRFILILLAAAMIFATVACTKNETKEPDTPKENDVPVNDESGDKTPVTDAKYPDATKILLADDGITVDGEAITDDDTSPVYAAHDIVYYHDGMDFTYGEGDVSDAHSTEEADAHTVVHIGKAGTYVISGTLSLGQIAVDLGDGAEEDPDAVVTLVLEGADITCTVAPAVIFYKVYECGDKYNAVTDADTTAAGANVIIADGSVNTLNGSYVAKIYKSVTLSEDGSEIVKSKKLHKYDGTLYSKMTMSISGEENGDGVLNVNAENEGIDSEMHLVIYGGNINIVSGDDGINTNEDGVSNTIMNGGTVRIRVDGRQGEGDGIDSNGWITVNGGTVIAEACSTSGDAGIDSDNGIHLNGGTVIASGNMYDGIDESEQNYIVFTFRERQNGGKTYSIKTADGDTVIECAPTNAFIYLVVSAPELTEGEYSLESDGEKLLVASASVGGFDGMGERPEMPDGMGERPEMPDGTGERPEMPDGMGEPLEMPDGMGERPEMPDGMRERPEIPDGMREQPEKPEDFDGFGDGRGNFRPDTSDASETFTISSGGNFFTVQGNDTEKYYKYEDFENIVVNESTFYDVGRIAYPYKCAMLATSYGGLCYFPSENGYIQIKFYGKDLVVGSIEEITDGSLEEVFDSFTAVPEE